MSDNMSDKIFMYLVVLPVLIFELFFLVLGIYEIIYGITHKEEFKMNLYDEENNCFAPNPPEMGYWEIIAEISSHNNISIKEAVKKYHELSGIPSNDFLEVLLNANEKDLIPYNSEVKICDDTEKLLAYGIQPDCAEFKTCIIDIVIDSKDNIGNRIYYLVSADSSLYSCEILQRID